MNRRTRMNIIGLLASCCLAFGQQLHAGTIHVPGDYPTIQAGIDAAVDGDEVVVADGTPAPATGISISTAASSPSAAPMAPGTAPIFVLAEGRE